MVEADKQRVGRYERIFVQLEELYEKTDNLIARMATTVALLHHKMPHFFWTGFYRVMGEELVVGPYQGPLACSVLSGGSGVCFACVEQGEPIIVPDVEAFEGHIACDSRSKSEVVIPLYDEEARFCLKSLDRVRRFMGSAPQGGRVQEYPRYFESRATQRRGFEGVPDDGKTFETEPRVIGVLDVDAKKKDAFCQSDVDGLLPIVERLVLGTSCEVIKPR